MTTSTNSTYSYRYDDEGQRIYKDAQGTKEYYVRDDKGREFAVYDASTDRLKMINLYGSYLIGRIDVSWTTGRVDARKFYMKDHLGSIRQTLNESGTVTMAMDYYAFGGTKNSYVLGGSVDKYKFTSKERDSETGLDYFGARYYDSKVGRWMSVDNYADNFSGLSPYNYCLNNPLKVVDPDGNNPFLLGAAIGAAVDFSIQATTKAIKGENVLDFNSYDYESIATSAVGGAIGAGLASKVSQLSTLTKTLVEMGTNASLSAGEQYVRNGEIKPGLVAMDVAIGQTAGKLGEIVGERIAKGTTTAKLLGKDAERQELIALKSLRPGRITNAINSRGSYDSYIMKYSLTTSTVAADATKTAVLFNKQSK